MKFNLKEVWTILEKKERNKIFYLDEGKIYLDLTYDQLIKKNIKDSNFNI